ncbi:hypothetical protein LCGC14_0817200 [marine sediment metagenome]|uniref:Uncharacterized protein n=1 Tax=marine sediment metagenome TaxID=412755 RepID=A0A0F9PPK8_9ZZZZ
MQLYRVTFDTTDYPFYVVECDEQAALKRAVQALKDYGARYSKKVSIERICSGVQLVLGALDEKGGATSGVKSKAVQRILLAKQAEASAEVQCVVGCSKCKAEIYGHGDDSSDAANTCGETAEHEGWTVENGKTFCSECKSTNALGEKEEDQ